MIRVLLFSVLMACIAVGGHTAPPASSPNGRMIINGRVARDGEFPYQVSIQKRAYFGDYSDHKCGGSVIDEHHILTASHCLYGQFLSQLMIVAGTRDLSVPTDLNRVNLTIEQAYLHEEYNDDYYLNDIALVRVSPSFPLNSKYVQPISLRAEQLQAPAECTVSGWGTTRQEPEPFPDILQVLELPFIDYEVCQMLYQDYTEGYFVPGMLCAGYIAGLKDACEGDSGGPLVCGGQLTGVVSWGEDCAQPDYPGVYADVAYYRDWIERTLARSYDDGGLWRGRRSLK